MQIAADYNRDYYRILYITAEKNADCCRDQCKLLQITLEINADCRRVLYVEIDYCQRLMKTTVEMNADDCID